MRNDLSLSRTSDYYLQHTVHSLNKPHNVEPCSLKDGKLKRPLDTLTPGLQPCAYVLLGQNGPQI